MPRSRRLTALARLVATARYSRQEELVAALRRAGIAATQATLSRDLRSLGVAKRPAGDGRAVYRLPDPAGETLDRGRQRLDLRAFVNEVRVAGNLAVVKAPPGHGNAVGRAVDLLEYDGVVGSVAGDDTLLVVLTSAARARGFKRFLDRLAAGGPDLSREA